MEGPPPFDEATMRVHDEATPPVFDEITGRPLNDPARVLVGEEPKGYNEVDSLDEAIALADARQRPISTPRSFDEWAELLELLTHDSERPPRFQAVNALQRGLQLMETTPAAYVDAIGQWVGRRLATGLGARSGRASPHISLKTLKVVISLLDGVVTEEEDEEETGISRYCVSMPSIFSKVETASELTGSLTGSAGGSEGGAGASVGEAFAVAVRAHCTDQLQTLAQLEQPSHSKWGDRPTQMIRAAARGAMIRAHGQRKDFGVEYTAQKRLQVSADELVAWEFRERSAGGPHTIDFKIEFVEPQMEAGEEVEVLPTERLQRHAGSVVTEAAGELVFSFNNEFSWVNNKAITLTLGQWPSRAGAAVHLPEPEPEPDFEPEPEPEPRSAAGMLRSMRSAPPPAAPTGGGAAVPPPPTRANEEEEAGERDQILAI